MASAAAGASVVYPFQPRARYEDYGEEQSPYRAQGYYPERPYAPQPADGLDRRYSHSLYHDAGAGAEQGGADSFGLDQRGVASTDNLQAPVGSPQAGGMAYGSQYQPHEPQPPFGVVMEPYGAPRPEPYVPARSPEVPQAVPDSQARLSVGSVYRPSQGGRGEFWGALRWDNAPGAPSPLGMVAPSSWRRGLVVGAPQGMLTRGLRGWGCWNVVWGGCFGVFWGVGDVKGQGRVPLGVSCVLGPPASVGWLCVVGLEM